MKMVIVVVKLKEIKNKQFNNLNVRKTPSFEVNITSEVNSATHRPLQPTPNPLTLAPNL